MSRESDRNVLNKIIASCDELRDLVAEIKQPMIAHLLEMVIIQAREARAGDGALDGELC